MNINFFKEDTRIRLSSKDQLKKWIQTVIIHHKKTTGDINFIFCSDRHLLAMNKNYLNHNTYTDILTFNNSENKNVIEGDIYISIDRVRENSLLFNSLFSEELHRVMIHGILHLLGFRDKSTKEKSIMRQKENECLAWRKF